MRARSGAVVPILVVVLVATAAASRSSGAEGGVDAADDPRLHRGGAVFQANCAACHGTGAEGRAGTGVEAGPPLTDLPVAYIDLVLRTGRMPIARPEAGVLAQRLGDDDREALVAWMRERFGLPGAIPDPGPGDAGRGLAPFVRHCAACHGAGGAGGVAGGGTFVPAIAGHDAVTVVEALRVGPFEMPAFSDELVDDDTAADIAAYLDAADDTPRTTLGLQELHPVGTAIAAGTLLLAGAGVVRLVARRADRGEA